MNWNGAGLDQSHHSHFIGDHAFDLHPGSKKHAIFDCLYVNTLKSVYLKLGLLGFCVLTEELAGNTRINAGFLPQLRMVIVSLKIFPSNGFANINIFGMMRTPFVSKYG